MNDLVEFLRARLDEDEQVARRAGETFGQIGETGVIVATEGDRAEECASANWAGIAEHIVRHDPARVLREVTAKRELLAYCERAMAHEDPLTRDRAGEVAMAAITVTYLASAYGDHSDYREEWRHALT